VRLSHIIAGLGLMFFGFALISALLLTLNSWARVLVVFLLAAVCILASGVVNVIETKAAERRSKGEK